MDRFGAAGAEPIHVGHSAATVVRLDRGYPSTLRFTGILDLSRLGTGDRYVDLALMFKSLRGTLNLQYGGPPAARRFVELYGADPDDPRISYYIDLDDSGDF